MLESVANLKKKSKKGATAENMAFQQLFLLVGVHLFKVRVEGATIKVSDEATKDKTKAVSELVLFVCP